MNLSNLTCIAQFHCVPNLHHNVQLKKIFFVFSVSWSSLYLLLLRYDQPRAYLWKVSSLFWNSLCQSKAVFVRSLIDHLIKQTQILNITTKLTKCCGALYTKNSGGNKNVYNLVYTLPNYSQPKSQCFLYLHILCF